MRLHYHLQIVVVVASVLPLPGPTIIQKHPNSQEIQLFGAVDKDDVETARKLLANGVNIDCRDQDRWTPLLHAAWNGKRKVAQLLLSKGANVNAVSDNKITPLIASLDHGDHTISKLLLKRGANVRVRDPEGNTTLWLAVQCGDVEIARRLIARGLSVNQTNSIGIPPLNRAIHNPAMVRLLLSHNANPNATIHREVEDSVFMYAVRERAVEAVKLMLSHGARVNYEGRYGRRALDCAVENNDKAMIRLLKQHGAR